jgi:hypothetical protein
MAGRQYEDRAGGPWSAGHEPLSIIHAHEHSDGHGGTHSHLHPHTGDNNHTGAGHPASPGNPDAGMPGVQLNSLLSPDPCDRAVAYLTACGVDVPRELAALDRAREAETHRVRAAADRARDLAISLKSEEKALLAEARGVNAGATGFTATSLGEVEACVAQLRAGLTAACLDDPQLARTVRRSVA